VACLATGVLAFYADRFLPITVTSLKVTPPVKPIYTAWNTFSRIDVFERKAHPEEKTPAMRRFVFDAGTAATGIQDLRPNVRDYLNKDTNDWEYSSGIAYLGKQQPKVLIIGSGAGSQVLDALHFGASSITAVEVNPIITDVVAHRMNDFWGGLFNQPEVHLVTAEGRNFVRSSHDVYDAIISVHTISNAAVASGALALSENYVLTREAFEDYLDHLSPDGVIYFTRPEPQIPRLFATAREALARRGIQDFPSHFYAYRIPPDDWEKRMFGADRPSFEAGFLVKKSAFTRDEISRINSLLGVGQPPRDASVPVPEVLYSPFAPGTGIYQTLLTTSNLAHVYQSGPRELEPATDDRPFFNHHTRWSAISGAMLHQVFAEKRLRQLLLGDLPLAELSLLALLVQSVVIAALLVLFPLARWSRSGLSAPSRWRFLAYFAALGFGFITIEMALLSQFSLFLGQPVYTYAVVLASLLIFTGIGANVSGRFTNDPRAAVKRIIPILLLILAVSAVIIPWVFSFALGLSLPLRVLLSMLVLAPLAICLGMPFPLGLRIVSSAAEALVPWAWGVNGFFTVIGTVMALILAMSFGFRMVLVLGGAAYLLAWAAIAQPRKAASVQLLDTGAAIASVLIAAILCGALTPLAEASSSKSLPACCRRDGKHHCARRLPEHVDDQSTVFRSKSEPCPYRAADVTPPEVTLSFPGARSLLAASHPNRLLTAAQLGGVSILRLFTHLDRGPPSRY
jgi:predicted membrane-bound spermidine synthase